LSAISSYYARYRTLIIAQFFLGGSEAYDASLILQYYVGIINHFPVED